MSERHYTIYSADTWEEEGEACSAHAYWDSDGEMIIPMTFDEAKKTKLGDGDHIAVIIPLDELERMERERAEMLEALKKIGAHCPNLGWTMRDVEMKDLARSVLSSVEGTRDE